MPYFYMEIWHLPQKTNRFILFSYFNKILFLIFKKIHQILKEKKSQFVIFRHFFVHSLLQKPMGKFG